MTVAPVQGQLEGFNEETNQVRVFLDFFLLLRSAASNINRPHNVERLNVRMLEFEQPAELIFEIEIVVGDRVVIALILQHERFERIHAGDNHRIRLHLAYERKQTCVVISLRVVLRLCLRKVLFDHQPFKVVGRVRPIEYGQLTQVVLRPIGFLARYELQHVFEYLAFLRTKQRRVVVIGFRIIRERHIIRDKKNARVTLAFDRSQCHVEAWDRLKRWNVELKHASPLPYTRKRSGFPPTFNALAMKACAVQSFD